jgi:hypothetical protein
MHRFMKLLRKLVIKVLEFRSQSRLGGIESRIEERKLRNS